MVDRASHRRRCQNVGVRENYSPNRHALPSHLGRCAPSPGGSFHLSVVVELFIFPAREGRQNCPIFTSPSSVLLHIRRAPTLQPGHESQDSTNTLFLTTGSTRQWQTTTVPPPSSSQPTNLTWTPRYLSTSPKPTSQPPRHRPTAVWSPGSRSWVLSFSSSTLGASPTPLESSRPSTRPRSSATPPSLPSHGSAPFKAS